MGWYYKEFMKILKENQLQPLSNQLLQNIGLGLNRAYMEVHIEVRTI